MIRQVFIAATAAAGLLLTGCASIMKGQNQSLSVVTNSNGAEVAGAKCQLDNSKGTWYVTTPGSVPVHRAYGDLSVTCKIDGQPDGIANVKSSTGGAVFGNILIGGGIGAGIDIGTGAAYDYPSLIAVTMGQTTQVDSSNAPSSAMSRPIDPKERVPYLNDEGQAAFQDFLTKPSPRAFAISSDGSWGSLWSEAQPGQRPPSTASGRAIASCSAKTTASCFLYVVDEQVVSAAPVSSAPAVVQVPAPPAGATQAPSSVVQSRPVPLK